jgi:hypothetical protein
MTPGERLKLAGEAAELLEERGFVSAARLRDGIVTLECWDHESSPVRLVRHVVGDAPGTTREGLAEACAAALRGARGGDVS